MSLGVLALISAVGAAGWLLVRLAQGDRDEANNVTLLKGVVWLALVAGLFAAKLWPLAFMMLLAAGGVMGIEIWRRRAIEIEEAGTTLPDAPASTRMTEQEAADILGVDAAADDEDIRAAHKRLISQLHPDKGGTDYLAAKINEARDRLLGRARE